MLAPWLGVRKYLSGKPSLLMARSGPCSFLVAKPLYACWTMDCEECRHDKTLMRVPSERIPFRLSRDILRKYDHIAT